MQQQLQDLINEWKADAAFLLSIKDVQIHQLESIVAKASYAKLNKCIAEVELLLINMTIAPVEDKISTSLCHSLVSSGK